MLPCMVKKILPLYLTDLHPILFIMSEHFQMSLIILNLCGLGYVTSDPSKWIVIQKV